MDERRERQAAEKMYLHSYVASSQPMRHTGKCVLLFTRTDYKSKYTFTSDVKFRQVPNHK